MRLSRRSFLVGSGAAAFVAACGDDGGNDGLAATTTTTTAPGGLVLGEGFDRNGQFVAGIPQRAPYLLFEATGGLAVDAPAELEFTVVDEGGEPVGGPVSVARHGDDIQRAYYPLEFTWPEPGTYTTRTEVQGQALESPMIANAPGGLAVPQVGQPFPAVTTPTIAAPQGVQTICTRDPACPFHDVSVDAVAGTMALVLLVSTPAFCQTQVCGPVLELLIAALPPDHPRITPIHLEVYPGSPPPQGQPSSVVTDLGLQWEPSLFVVAGDGLVSARLDNVFDGTELAEALAPFVG